VAWGKDVPVPRPSKYPEEFRRDAVELVLASPQRTVAEIAKELGLNRETLRQWVKAEREARAAGAGRGRPVESGQLSTDEREELKRLRKQVAELQLEKEILRKAAAYFAKEMGR
jgi:transposase